MVSKSGKWKCEFCSNVTEGVDKEFSTAAAQVDTVDYLLGKAAGWDGKAADAPLLLLCFDASGSMGVSTEVSAAENPEYFHPDADGGGTPPGASAGASGASAREAAFSAAPASAGWGVEPGSAPAAEPVYQNTGATGAAATAEWACAACTFLNPPEAPICAVCGAKKSDAPIPAPEPPQSLDLPPLPTAGATKHVSRLDAIRLAVDSHLARVARTHPHHRVGVVVFNDAVAVIGDGTQPTLKISGDVLLDYDMLFSLGVRAAGTSKAGVAESRGRQVYLHVSSAVHARRTGASTSMTCAPTPLIGSIAAHAPGRCKMVCSPLHFVVLTCVHCA